MSQFQKVEHDSERVVSQFSKVEHDRLRIMLQFQNLEHDSNQKILDESKDFKFRLAALLLLAYLT